MKNAEAMTRLISRQCLFRPLLDTYTVTTMSMELLVDHEIPERELMKRILDEVRLQLDQGLIKYGLYTFPLTLFLIWWGFAYLSENVLGVSLVFPVQCSPILQTHVFTINLVSSSQVKVSQQTQLKMHLNY